MKLLGLFLICCVFTKKLKAQKSDQKFIKTGTGKNRGLPKHCAMYGCWHKLFCLLFTCKFE